MNREDILEVKSSLIEDNGEAARRLRAELRGRKTFYLNMMSSPGAGKTSVILRTLEMTKGLYNIGVMEADIDSDVDAKCIREHGFPAVQLHTGGMCHLDADMSRQGIEHLDDSELDAVILENVGNLVCPAEFDTGAARNAVILSVPEGDDKPEKYPLIFRKCEVVLINKVDTLEIFDFDFERLKNNIHRLNRDATIIPVSAKTGEGFGAWVEWLSEQIREWNGACGV